MELGSIPLHPPKTSSVPTVYLYIISTSGLFLLSAFGLFYTEIYNIFNLILHLNPICHFYLQFFIFLISIILIMVMFIILFIQLLLRWEHMVLQFLFSIQLNQYHLVQIYFLYLDYY